MVRLRIFALGAALALGLAAFVLTVMGLMNADGHRLGWLAAGGTSAIVSSAIVLVIRRRAVATGTSAS